MQPETLAHDLVQHDLVQQHKLGESAEQHVQQTVLLTYIVRPAWSSQVRSFCMCHLTCVSDAGAQNALRSVSGIGLHI